LINVVGQSERFYCLIHLQESTKVHFINIYKFSDIKGGMWIVKFIELFWMGRSSQLKIQVSDEEEKDLKRTTIK